MLRILSIPKATFLILVFFSEPVVSQPNICAWMHQNLKTSKLTVKLDDGSETIVSRVLKENPFNKPYYEYVLQDSTRTIHLIRYTENPDVEPAAIRTITTAANVMIRFPKLTWPEQLFINFSNYPGSNFLGGPHWISLHSAFQGTNDSAAPIIEHIEPLVIHEMGHVAFTAELLKRLGIAEEIERMATSYFKKSNGMVKFKNFAKIDKWNEYFKIAEQNGQLGKLTFSYYLQELLSDLLPSLYYKNHNILDEELAASIQHRNGEPFSPESHPRGRGFNGSRKITETLTPFAICSNHVFFTAYGVIKPMSLGIFNLFHRATRKAMGLPALQPEAPLEDPLSDKTVTPYNYLNGVRLHIVNKGYYLKAITEEKEEALAMAVQMAFLDFTMDTDIPSPLIFPGKFYVGLLSKLVPAHFKLTKLIDHYAKEYGLDP